MTELLLNLAPAILGTLTGIGGGAIFAISAWRRSKNAEAKLAEAQAALAEAQAAKAVKDLYEERIKDLHEAISKSNDTEIAHAGRIAELNRTLDDKTDRIRELTDKSWQAEQELNHANTRITEMTADIGRKELLIQHYRDWLCKEADCPQRQPPNPKIAGKKYTKPAPR